VSKGATKAHNSRPFWRTSAMPTSRSRTYSGRAKRCRMKPKSR